MSTLLEQASLVMIPSGYKEDIVYSQIPTNGNGDLSFTRASNGTRINSAGLVEVCPWNLIGYSEEFNNTSGWLVQNGASITANSTTAPNGTTTADTISFGTSSISACYQSVTNGGGVFTISVYARCSSGTQSFKFIIYNGTDGQIDGSVFTVTTQWQRFEQIYTVSTASNWYIANANDSVARSIFIWGAQLNIGSTAKPYFPTTDRLNVPRLTYQNGGGGCPSLLLEKQSTNICLYSETFENWTTGFNALSPNAVTANYGVSPDGTTNADRIQLTVNASNVASQIYQFPSTSGTTYTASVYLKSLSGTPTISIVDSYNITGGFQLVTLTTEWVRYTKTFVAGAGGILPQFLLYHGTTSSSADFLAWGFQVEASSYPTSYIPTTSASATRVADACYKTGISSLIGQTEGTMFADFLTSGLPSIDQYFMNLSDGSTSNIIYIGFYSNILVARIIDAGSLLVNINVGLATNTRYKVGFAYKSNDCVLYINGSNSGSDTSTTIPATSKLSYNDFSNEACYQLNESVIFKTRLTNAELASLTTI